MPPRKREGAVPVGKRIKALREGKKIGLETVANDTGIAVDELKRIEAGRKMPPVGALLQIARALRVDSGELLKETEDKRRDRAAAYVKRTESYAYTTLTPGAENKHLKAFRVVVPAREEHRGVGYQHEGEEFVYVLAGRIEVTVGEHVNTVAAGESLHFNSGVRHLLKNTGLVDAELLVVVYSP